MFNNKKILIVIGLLGLTIIVGLVVVLLRTGQSTFSDSYTINFSIRGEAVTTTLVQNKKSSEISSSEIGKYALISFNSTKDVFWAACSEGYNLSDHQSLSGNNTVNDPSLGIGMEVLPGKDNILSITCVK